VAAPKRRPRGHIRELPSGSFQAIVYAGTDPLTRKPRRLRETAKTYAAAAEALTRLQSQVDQNRHLKSDITVSRSIALWLDTTRHEDTTRARYEDLIRIYIAPTLGNLVAGKLDAEIVERFYTRLQRCRALCDGRPRAGHVCRPLSASTVRKIHYIISAALEQAVRWRHLGVNPASLAVAPTPRRPEPDPPTTQEAAAIIGAAWRDPEWGLLLWLVMVTGMRRGELSALRWRHIDLRTDTILIQRANSQVKSIVREKSTKTQQQRRVAIDEVTVALLTEHRQRWEQRCADLGVKFHDDLFVFSPAVDASKPYAPHSLSQRYRLLAGRLGLRSTRLHALRHYSATELIAAGVDVRTVAGRLGHGSGGATTLKVYAAWVSEADRRAATAMAGIMPAPIAAQMPPRGPYAVIAAELRDQIGSGELRPGDQLPTLVELAARYGVSDATAHRAVDLLRRERLIEVARGRRAIVSGTRAEHDKRAEPVDAPTADT
jgi:integrase